MLFPTPCLNRKTTVPTTLHNLLLYLETNVSVQRRSFLYLGTLLDYFSLSCTMQCILFQIACFLVEFPVKPEGGTLQKYLGTIRILRQQRDWLGGVRKMTFFSAVPLSPTSVVLTDLKRTVHF